MIKTVEIICRQLVTQNTTFSWSLVPEDIDDSIPKDRKRHFIETLFQLGLWADTIFWIPSSIMILVKKDRYVMINSYGHHGHHDDLSPWSHKKADTSLGYLFVRKVNLKGIKTALIIISNTGVVVMAVWFFFQNTTNRNTLRCSLNYKGPIYDISHALGPKSSDMVCFNWMWQCLCF